MGLTQWIALWLLVMGVWPLEDPGHKGTTPASVLDLALHIAAGLYLLHWWVVMRE